MLAEPPENSDGVRRSAKHTGAKLNDPGSSIALKNESISGDNYSYP